MSELELGSGSAPDPGSDVPVLEGDVGVSTGGEALEDGSDSCDELEELEPEELELELEELELEEFELEDGPDSELIPDGEPDELESDGVGGVSEDGSDSCEELEELEPEELELELEELELEEFELEDGPDSELTPDGEPDELESDGVGRSIRWIRFL